MVPQCSTRLFISLLHLCLVIFIYCGGKLDRAMSVVDTVEILKSRELSDDEYFKAAGVLGWSVEQTRACKLSSLIEGFYLLFGLPSSCKPIMDASIPM
jgi:hypothetical protein